MAKTYVIGIGEYQALGKKVLQHMRNSEASNKSQPLELETKVFPDGESYHRFISKVKNANIVLVCGTIDDTHTLALYDLGGAAAKYSAESLHLVIPYFGYSTMERAVIDGEVVKAKARARLLSTIPHTKSGNHVYFLDLHAEGIPFYLEGEVRGQHIYAEKIIIEAIKASAAENKAKEFVVASTDAGRAKWVESLAKKLSMPVSFCLKHRAEDGKLSLSAVSAHVKGKHVIIYDDMIRTGGSLVQAAKAYLGAGAKSVDAVTTHGILPGNSLNNVLSSNTIKTIYATDSHPQAVKLAKQFKCLRVKSVAGLLASAIEENLK